MKQLCLCINLLTLSLLLSLRANAQSIYITGKILDEKSLLPIDGATIKSGNFGTSSIKDGSFRLVLELNNLKKFGFQISSIGYTNKLFAFTGDKSIEIKLSPTNLNLNESRADLNASDILKKAINNIPNNYSQEDFTIEGFIKMHQIVKDSFAYYKFFKNEAIIKVAVTPYEKNSKPSKTILIQNRSINADSLKIEDKYFRFVNGYILPIKQDYVHERSFFLDESNLNQYKFKLNGKCTINDRSTYVINFRKLKKQNQEGVIFIDSATYAVSSINFTTYNIKKIGSTKIDETSISVNYQLKGDKWYLQNRNFNGLSNQNGLEYTRFEEYHTIEIYNTPLEINYADIIQNNVEDLTLKKPVDKKEWEKYDPFIDSLAANKLITNINPPKIDNTYSVEKVSSFKKVQRLYRNYIVSGGLRTVYKINQSHLIIDNFQPLINKKLTGLSNYNFSTNTQLRIWKPFFLETGGAFNWGIGGVNFKQTEFDLIYQFEFNKPHHPIFISPFVGYSFINLKKKKDLLYRNESVVYGANFIYEQKRRLSYIFSLKYYDVQNATNRGLILRNNKFQPSIGFIRRF